MALTTDQELAQHAQLGETEAYGELVRRYQGSVFNVCYRLLGERGEAEDQTQEAFIRAYQRLESYDSRRPFGPWIRRVATNLCLNHLQVRQPVEFPLEEERDVDASGVLPNPEIAYAQREKAENIRAALLSLPSHYRAVIELRHFQDLSYQEIAEHLQLPLSDVKSFLFRARRILAARLKNDEIFRSS